MLFIVENHLHGLSYLKLFFGQASVFNEIRFGTKLPLTINIFIQPLNYFMRSLLYLIAVILIIGWILGFFVYSAGGLIHILLIIAIIALILGVIRRA